MYIPHMVVLLRFIRAKSNSLFASFHAMLDLHETSVVSHFASVVILSVPVQC